MHIYIPVSYTHLDKEEAEKEDFNNENQILTNLQLLVGKISALTNPVTYIFLNVALVVLLYVGAIRVDGGLLTQGKVIALVNYMSQILVELIKLANTIVLSTKAVACGNRIQSVFEMKPSIMDDFVSDVYKRQLLRYLQVLKRDMRSTTE